MIAKRFVALSFALVATLAITACAATEDDPAIGEGEDDLTVGVGQICAGGFAPATCAAGLKCVLRGRIGKCAVDPTAAQQGASENETCGGTARIKCKAGLTCKKRAGASETATGKCVEAQVTCQAIPECDEGHSKVASESACPQDAACYKRTRCGRSIWCSDAPPDGAGPGERCGTGFAGTIRCQPGLTCSATIGLGTCR